MLLAFLITTPTLAKTTPLNWAALDSTRDYKLAQEIKFDGIITINAGDSFELKDYAGDNPFFVYYEMRAKNCAQPKLTSEMILITPELSDSDDRAVGVELDENCTVGVWVELKDLYSPSLFE